MIELTTAAHPQSLTPDPAAWRPMSYANLQKPSSQTATYVDIWKDAIEANNRAYKARGDLRFSGGNAPVTEAHFVIWSARRSVVLSVLDTAIECSVKQVAPDAHATVKLCPMRIAIYEGLQVKMMDGGRGCFLELAPGGLCVLRRCHKDSENRNDRQPQGRGRMLPRASAVSPMKVRLTTPRADAHTNQPPPPGRAGVACFSLQENRS